MKSTSSSLPKLRFSGFEKPWDLKPMSQLLRLTDRPFKMADDGVYSLVKVRRGNNGVVSRGLFEGRKVLVKSQFKVHKDDFIISKRQIVHQACGIVPEDLDGSIVSNEYDVFRPSEECCIRYFDYYCYRPEMRHAFFLSCVGVHLEKMLFKTGDWLKRRFHFPTLPEQRKIADFLTAVDGRIAQLSRKKALLEAYKKGVMQQLFTQALRFQDDHGNDFPEWEEKQLGELCDTFKSGKGITAERIAETGKYPVYGGNGLRGYTDDFTHNGDYLLIGRQGALCGNINRVSGKSYISEHAIAVSGNKLANTEWLAQRLGFLNLNRLSESSAQPGLAVNKLERLKLLVPSVPEQTKIANFLTALDRKIEAVATQIAHTRTWKKGLLQQMFV